MNLPNIYKYLDVKYNPIVRYLFILPTPEFIDFLKSINSGVGVAKEMHGYELESDFIEFWDFSNGEEHSVKINNHEFIDIIKPLQESFIKEFSNYKEDIDEIIFKILDRNIVSENTFSKLEKLFLEELEWFYRNYGNAWNLDDFSNKIKSNKKKLEKILIYLSEKEIISINDTDKYSFKVLKLPRLD